MTERTDPAVINRLLKDIASVGHLSPRWPWNDLTTLANEILALRQDIERLGEPDNEPDEADYPGKYRGSR